jgi:hypothetical protein
MFVYAVTVVQYSFTRKSLLNVRLHGNAFCTELFPRNGLYVTIYILAFVFVHKLVARGPSYIVHSPDYFVCDMFQISLGSMQILYRNSAYILKITL